MHNKDALFVSDDAITGTGRSWAYEYDGLDSGEVAWIMSKQFAKLWSASGGIRATDPATGAPALSGPYVNSDMLVASPVDFSSFAHNIARLEEMIYRSGNGAPNRIPPGLLGPDGAMLANNAPSGIAYGPDRMQRLAYTKWIEALFVQRIGRQPSDLAAITIAADETQGALDSELDYYSKLRLRPSQYPGEAAVPPDNVNASALRGCVQGASIFAVPDIAYGLQVVQQGTPLQVAVPQLQGLFVMEQGPFLRGYGVDHDPVTIVAHGIQGRAGRGRELHLEVDRHLGSELAQRALTAELKKIGLFNWTPDGICLSKYATGPDGEADAEFDSRSGQLFNVGVQGPCISTSWVGRKDMVCLPMDKVFMLVVGQVSYELAEAGTNSGKGGGVAALDDTMRDAALACVNAAGEMTKCLASANFTPVFYDPSRATTADKVDAYSSVGYPAKEGLVDQLTNNMITKDKEARENAYVRDGGGGNDRYMRRARTMADAASDLATAYANFQAGASAVGSAGTYVATQLLEAKNQIRIAETTSDAAARSTALTAANTALDAVKDAVGETARIEVHSGVFQRTAADLRSGEIAVKRALLSNFRILRATSSFLINNSHAKSPTESPTGWKASRCGLPIGYSHAGGAGVEALSGNAEYILGGWCIGTVIDSAASRSTIHAGQVRTAPSSMAININVNVEWWSADKLYQNYQDVDRGVYAAGGAQKTEGTVHMRTQPGFRVAAVVAGELAISEDQAEELLRRGRYTNQAGTDGDLEGRFKRPNPSGNNADAGSSRFTPDRAGEIGGTGNDLRVWNAAQPITGATPDAISIQIASTAHVNAL